jgi:hypothetical protein
MSDTFVISGLTYEGKRRYGLCTHASAVLADDRAYNTLRSDRTADLVAVISAELADPFWEAADALVGACRDTQRPAIWILPWREPPVSGLRADGKVVSFLCGRAAFQELLASHPGLRVGEVAFQLLSDALSGRSTLDMVLVRQLPLVYLPQVTQGPRTAVIMAHKGQKAHLKVALDSIARMSAGSPIRIKLGIDDAPDGYADLVRRYKCCQAYYVTPAPVGHFVIKQHFAADVDDAVIAFNDSDDISCGDRLTVSLGALSEGGCDFVGCHELRLDEINHTVEAYRFPLDVNASLERDQSGGMLLGTMVGLRSKYMASGGLSTDQMIANDTQFKLRLYFLARMRNVDAFLYIRRRHSGALTVRPETGLGTDIRKRLRTSWNEAFAAVRRGEISLEKSTLHPVRRSRPYAMTRFGYGTSRHRRAPAGKFEVAAV